MSEKALWKNCLTILVRNSSFRLCNLSAERRATYPAVEPIIFLQQSYAVLVACLKSELCRNALEDLMSSSRIIWVGVLLIIYVFPVNIKRLQVGRTVLEFSFNRVVNIVIRNYFSCSKNIKQKFFRLAVQMFLSRFRIQSVFFKHFFF